METGEALKRWKEAVKIDLRLYRFYGSIWRNKRSVQNRSSLSGIPLNQHFTMDFTNPVLARLGYPPDARLVIFHADDVGMCYGSNRAFLELLEAGVVKCGSIMAPCPWAPEILDYCAEHPEIDVGVHLTLNSEWSSYRWGPVGERTPESGLLDEHGYFWRRPHQTQAMMRAEAAIAEFRSQIEMVHRWGVDFTHIDTHMGVAILPELFEAYIELGFASNRPVLIPRQLSDYTRSLSIDQLTAPNGDAQWYSLIVDLEARGMPLVDTFCITPVSGSSDLTEDRADRYEEILRNLPTGITYFSLHPNAPGDIEAIVPERAWWRTFEYEYFQSQRLKDFLAEEGIIPIGYREIRQTMQL